MPIFINQTAVKNFNFSGGECQISLGDMTVGNAVSVKAYLFSSDDIMQLLLTVDSLRRIDPDILIDLTIPYVPYARQDRVCNDGEALSIHVMTSLINNLNCHSVTILDPHSDVTPALINRVRIIHQADLVSQSKHIQDLLKSKPITVIAPDAGAEKKTRTLAKALHDTGIEVDVAFASKERDVKTGNILKTIIPDNVTGKSFLIVDDICDGGLTFTNLAKELKSHGAQDIYLYVTHGIFSKGIQPLKQHLTHVYCHHSFSNISEPEFLTIME